LTPPTTDSSAVRTDARPRRDRAASSRPSARPLHVPRAEHAAGSHSGGHAGARAPGAADAHRRRGGVRRDAARRRGEGGARPPRHDAVRPRRPAGALPLDVALLPGVARRRHRDDRARARAGRRSRDRVPVDAPARAGRGRDAHPSSVRRPLTRAADTGVRSAALPPTPAQAAAVAALADAVRSGEHASFLLHGITGSGKTEVFLAAAETTLAAGRDVLVLVPEIALTHQLVARVRERFGDAVAVLHSGLGPKERWTDWRRIASGEARVVVGARSAVFAPLRRVGLVVVDEEHDGAYKQEEGIRYHARDLAVVRARLAKAVVVLASATPSAESYQAALDGRHRLLELRTRPTGQPLPVVDVIDLRGRVRSFDTGLLSDELQAAMAETLGRGEQSLVFLNRRG